MEIVLTNSYITDTMAEFSQELDLVGRNYSITLADLGVITHITETCVVRSFL